MTPQGQRPDLVSVGSKHYLDVPIDTRLGSGGQFSWGSGFYGTPWSTIGEWNANNYTVSQLKETHINRRFYFAWFGHDFDMIWSVKGSIIFFMEGRPVEKIPFEVGSALTDVIGAPACFVRRGILLNNYDGSSIEIPPGADGWQWSQAYLDAGSTTWLYSVVGMAQRIIIRADKMRVEIQSTYASGTPQASARVWFGLASASAQY
jgi:hypothetical protein